ncbi:peptidylprolyl isomerase [Litorivivens sp.]|uniref:FKBP-type peptidyl-prolyl cis-trans isomerase n=1 Tax=Litorivivens sp. TaxID=2020868 RepID=UPI003567F8FB
MQIEKNRVVSFHYRLSEQSGSEIEHSYDGEPSLYLHGARNILPALEKALAGLSAGDKIEVSLTPEQAYGLRQEGRVQRIPAKYLKHEGKMKPGQVVRYRDDNGTQQATVIKVGKFSVDVDANHPLAGKALEFAIEIVDVREASADEIAHGHAHGPGGHHH